MNNPQTHKGEGEPDFEMLDIPPLFGMPSPQGYIWVSDITPNSANSICSALLKAANDDPSRPVMMYIHSPGGCVDSLISIISVMDSIPNQIVTVCVGIAASAGAVILSHGDFRFVAPHGRVMIHELSSGTIGNVNDMDNDAKEAKRLNSQIMDILAKNCQFQGGGKALRKMLASEKRDLYMNARQAVDFGIVDNIGVPRLSKSTVWNLTVQGRKA